MPKNKPMLLKCPTCGGMISISRDHFLPYEPCSCIPEAGRLGKQIPNKRKTNSEQKPAWILKLLGCSANKRKTNSVQKPKTP